MTRERQLWRGLRHIVRVTRSSPRYFTIGGLAASLFAVMTIVSSRVLGGIVDRIVLPAVEDGRVAAGSLALAAAAVMGVGLARAVGIVGRRYGAYLAMYDLQRRARRAVVDRYLDLPLEWHRRHTTGELLSIASSDVDEAYRVSAPLPMALSAVVLLGVTSVLLVAADPFLAAIGLTVAPALAIVNYAYQGRMKTAARLAQEARAEVAHVAHESFDAALVVKTLGREEAETRRFAAPADELRDRMVHLARLRGTFDPILEALPSVGILLVLLVGIARVADGALSAGELIQFAYLFQLLAIPMRAFGWVLGDLPRGVAGMERVDRVLAATGARTYGAAGGAGEGGADVELHAVGYRHGATGGTSAGRRGVHDLDLRLPPGRTVAVVGATGSGKTTIASLLVRLLDPETGQLTLDGRPLTELSRAGLAETATIVLQDAFLFDQTVRDNIALGADVTDDEVVAAARLARAHGFITALDGGYDQRVGERGASLSGGQRQRIALARALVRRPRLLVLDDATSAVDPAVETDILRGIAAADLAATVAIVAYRRSSIALADLVAYVADGEVVAVGTHDELMASEPGYARILTAYERDERDRGGTS